MKYIALTFDDGRFDNYLIAKSVMDKYGFCGTVYITTGFIDNTWEESEVLQTPTRPLTVDEIKALYESGWEIGLHGDKHQTQVEDMRNALNKLRLWGIDNAKWGISVPNSKVEEIEIEKIINSDYGCEIAYIRRGRRCNTKTLKNKILYGLYSVLKLKGAYRCFNSENAFTLASIDRTNIPSVVIRSNDEPDMIVDYIKKLPEGSVVVFMLHSILPIDHAFSEKDPWSWEEKRFDSFCASLNAMVKNNQLEVLPAMELLNGLCY